jgi:hypothetical protein
MKPLEPDDPHELVGVSLAGGDRDFMAECLVEEYLLLGWNDRQIMSLFTRPCFGMTNQIYRNRGHDYVEGLIARVRAKWAPNETDGRHA